MTAKPSTAPDDPPGKMERCQLRGYASGAEAMSGRELVCEISKAWICGLLIPTAMPACSHVGAQGHRSMGITRQKPQLYLRMVSVGWRH